VHEDAFTEARTAFQRESTEAADYGTYIHTLCEYSLKHDIKVESPHEMTNKFMDGFWAWCKKNKVKVIAMEHEVVTDTYGGRLDLVCELNGVITLVDFKTGKSSYYETWKYQLAGYRQAWNTTMQTIRAKSPTIKGLKKPRIKSHGILKFNKETMKVNYKDFNEYQTTRTNPETKEKEKYTRTYETDRATFNALVKIWWLTHRGMAV
jgi:hypothetical protein